MKLDKAQGPQLLSDAYDKVYKLRGELNNLAAQLRQAGRPETGDSNADSYANALLDEVDGELVGAATLLSGAMDDLKMAEETIEDANVPEVEA